MKHLGIFLVTSIAVAACASHNAPPAASSDSVAQASDVPVKGPDFAPASPDGVAAAPADTRRANNATRPPPSLNAPRDSSAAYSGTPSNGAAYNGATNNDTVGNNWGNGADGSSGVSAGNVAASPAPQSSEPDSSAVNQRERSSAALTPMDQGPSAADRKITQRIRQAVMRDNTLSFTAKNVKIITINGKVTLRGAVKTEAERAAIEVEARGVAGGDHVESQLEISK
jgi:hyperosmotically inducible protein